MTKKGKRIAIGLSAVSAVICLVLLAGYIGLRMLLFPGGLKHSRYDAEHMNRLYHSYPYAADWLDKEIEAGSLRDTFVVMDGRTMHALYMPAVVPTTKTAFIIHGWTSCAPELLHIGYMYHCDLDYNIFLPDLNGHGRSGGSGAQMGWYDRLDCMRWMEVANALFSLKDASGKVQETEMVVHGISMGAATTMDISGEKQESYVKAFVEDCGYTSPWDVAMWDQRSNPLRTPLCAIANFWCNMLYGWDLKEGAPIKQISKCQHPMLFIHGDDDDFVPTDMVYPLYEAKKGEKTLYIAEGSAHALSYRDHPSDYTDAVRAFLEKYVP